MNDPEPEQVVEAEPEPEPEAEKEKKPEPEAEPEPPKPQPKPPELLPDHMKMVEQMEEFDEDDVPDDYQFLSNINQGGLGADPGGHHQPSRRREGCEGPADGSVA